MSLYARGTRVCFPSERASFEEMPQEGRQTLAELATRRAARLDEHALLVLIAATSASGRRSVRGHVATTATAPAALVVGAHPLCDVNDVHGACLRHLALWIDPTVSPGCVHAMDLNTSEGIVVAGERRIRRADASGPLRMRAGSADILTLALLPRELVDVESLFAAFGLESSHPSAPMAVAIPHDSRHASARGVRRCAPLRLSRDEVTRVTVSHVGDVHSLRPTALDLDRGFLLGRYERCNEQLAEDNISRVHALLVASGDRVLVIDTSSTNGTDILQGGQAHRTISLGVIQRAAAVQRSFGLSLAGTLVEVL